MGELVKKSIIQARETLVKTLQDLTLEQLQTIPNGFNNNIYWQVGHILVAGDTFFLNGKGNVEKEKTFFAPGTRPTDWDKNVPSFESLLKKLSNQTFQILKLSTNDFNEPLEKPFLGNSIRGELVAMGAFHEAMHLGQIQMLKRLVSN